MLKVMLCSCRHPTMTRSHFFGHLVDVHAPLVLSVPEFLKYLRRYVQNHTLLEEDGATVPTAYRRATERDSVIELWFESSRTLAEAMNEPRYLELVRPDEARFNDLSKLIVLMTEEKVIFDGPTSSLKAFDFIKRKESISREEFLERLSLQGSWLAANAEYRRIVAKRSHNIAVPNDAVAFAPAAAYDGVVELWLNTFDIFGGVQQSCFHAREEEFIDARASFSVLATEVPIYPASAHNKAYVSQ